MWKTSKKWKENKLIDFREVVSEDGRLMETNRSGPVENIYYYYYYYYYYYFRISHFSALAGKYSPILGCSNQQD